MTANQPKAFVVVKTLTTNKRKERKPKIEKEAKIPKRIEAKLKAEPFIPMTNTNLAFQPNSIASVLFTAHEDINTFFTMEQVKGFKAQAGCLTVSLKNGTKIEISALASLDIRDKTTNRIIKEIPQYSYKIVN
jgi:hypothetical protein